MSHQNKKVAIKKITPFHCSIFCLRTLKEIKLSRWFSHENIISKYLRYSTHALLDDHSQDFDYQTLQGLKAPHSSVVLHQDLQPLNLILNSNCDLKVRMSDERKQITLNMT
ncbi:hypothetical protein DFH28DRAFT_952784 [Melampsora americana]|nr:hypothetical protein DFH28DRAFT_952784 [Melampsora americana]